MRRALRSTFSGRVASVLSGSLAGQGLVLLSYPVLSRLYDPVEFGLLTVFVAVTGLLGVVSTGALESAVPIPRDDRDAAAVAWTSLAWVAGTATVVGLAGLVVAGPVTSLVGAPGLAPWWWLIALTGAVLGVYLVLSEWMVRDRSYAALGRRNLFQGVGQVGVQLGGGLLGAGTAALFLGPGAGRLLGLGGLLSRRGLLRQPRPTRAQLRATARRFRRFPALALPSNLLNAAGLETPLLVISAIYGSAAAGLLGMTVRLVGGPATIVGQAVNQVFTGESSATLRGAQGTMGRAVRGAVGRLLLVGLVPALVLLVFGPDLFGLVLGPEWTDSGQYARILAVAYLLQFAVLPVSPTLFLVERQGLELGWGVLRLVLAVGGPASCGLLGLGVEAAVVALAAGQVVGYVVLYRLCVSAADASDAATIHTQE